MKFSYLFSAAILTFGLMTGMSEKAEARRYGGYRSYSSHTTIVNNHYGYHGGSGFGSAFVGGMAGSMVGNALTAPHYGYGGYGYGGYGYSPAPVVVQQAPPVVIEQQPQQVIVQQPQPTIVP